MYPHHAQPQEATSAPNVHSCFLHLPGSQRPAPHSQRQIEQNRIEQSKKEQNRWPSDQTRTAPSPCRRHRHHYITTTTTTLIYSCPTAGRHLWAQASKIHDTPLTTTNNKKHDPTSPSARLTLAPLAHPPTRPPVGVTMETSSTASLAPLVVSVVSRPSPSPSVSASPSCVSSSSPSKLSLSGLWPSPLAAWAANG